MKINDSGMPDEKYWNSLFNVESIIDWLGIERHTEPIVEVGCGYGTFTIPVAQSARNIVCAYDIESGMIEATQNNLLRCGLNNVKLIERDVVENGLEEESGNCGLVLMFNILHFTDRGRLLAEAKRVLSDSGEIAVIHWRRDIPTPRGPSLAIRPTADEIVMEGMSVGLKPHGSVSILEPYHWGIKLVKE